MFLSFRELTNIIIPIKTKKTLRLGWMLAILPVAPFARCQDENAGFIVKNMNSSQHPFKMAMTFKKLLLRAAIIRQILLTEAGEHDKIGIRK